MHLLLALIIFAFSPAASAEEYFKIGANFSLSGWAAPGGVTELNAIKMAVEEINAQGGVEGKKIELVIEDNNSDVKKAVVSVQKLISIDKVKAILGPNWAEFSDAVAPVAEQAQVSMITASGYSPTLNVGRRHVFTLLPDHDLIVYPLAEYVIGKKYEKIAIISSATTYYQSLAQSFKGFMRAKELQLAEESEWNTGTVDYKAYITKLKAKGIKAAVVFLSQGGELASFLRQARDLKFGAAIFTSNAPFYDELLKQNLGLLEGAVAFEYRATVSKDFFAKYNKLFPESSSHSIPRAYDTVYLLKSCVSLPAEEISSCLRKADYSGVSGRIRFSAFGALVPDGPQSELFQFVGGKAKPLS